MLYKDLRRFQSWLCGLYTLGGFSNLSIRGERGEVILCKINEKHYDEYGTTPPLCAPVSIPGWTSRSVVIIGNLF